ncbi:uncharacterized protein EV422DRAFT_569463 [Fimicolochytrium jonesii]|uniref:uncharacterized protein n=1 Tax=Fimicolochytrium jonesii TaxID=1396493 RepID=UPI0022FEFAEB|nr:uncharacterized protein EV422DRAFT_569463 [Fimicolochytrium jonesii]KAI8818800.1 hypothetical protein EV422DRAFT_569463 [Fimicolochytrium jonesii]
MSGPHEAVGALGSSIPPAGRGKNLVFGAAPAHHVRDTAPSVETLGKAVDDSAIERHLDSNVAPAVTNPSGSAPLHVLEARIVPEPKPVNTAHDDRAQQTCVSGFKGLFRNRKRRYALAVLLILAAVGIAVGAVVGVRSKQPSLQGGEAAADPADSTPGARTPSQGTPSQGTSSPGPTVSPAAAPGTLFRELYHLATVTSIETSHYGKQLLSVDTTGMVRVTDIATGVSVRNITPHDHSNVFLAASPDGSFFSGAGGPTRIGSPPQIRHWDTASGQLIRDYTPSLNLAGDVGILALTLSASGFDGLQLFSLWTDGTVMRTGTVSGARQIYPAADGTTMYSFDASTGVSQWNLTSSTKIREYPYSRNTRIALTPDDKKLFRTESGDNNSTIVQIDTATGASDWRLARPSIDRIMVSPDGKQLFTSEDSVVHHVAQFAV